MNYHGEFTVVVRIKQLIFLDNDQRQEMKRGDISEDYRQIRRVLLLMIETIRKLSD
jgi:hypothetical protein